MGTSVGEWVPALQNASAWAAGKCMSLQCQKHVTARESDLGQESAITSNRLDPATVKVAFAAPVLSVLAIEPDSSASAG